MDRSAEANRAPRDIRHATLAGAPAVQRGEGWGASSRRKPYSATSNVLQMPAVAFSTLLHQFRRHGPHPDAANGDSTRFVVRGGFQYTLEDA